MIEKMSIETKPESRLAKIANQLAECKEHQSASKCGPPINERDVVAIIGELRHILFPSLRGSDAEVNQKSLESTLSGVHDRFCKLILQMSKTQNWQSLCETVDAESVIVKYLARLPEIRAALVTDIQAAYDGDPACRNTDEVLLCYPGFLAVTVYRMAHELHLLGVPLIPRMMTEWVHGETGIDIHPGATIGNHFFIDHGTGVVIGETCNIGEYVKIYQGVTLGALSFPTDERGELVRSSKRHPTIEDRVVIYANATVLGGNTNVGHDSVIGSSVWLTYSVEPFTTVMMERPKLRLRNQTPNEFEPPLDFQI